ncbi:MAG: hypothetical protein AB8B63_21450 [Granulosicoccus sp.]
MILTLVGYGAPVVLAYALFIGIAKQFNPFRRPMEESRRSVWLLGLLAGTATWIMLAAVMALVYTRPDSTVNIALMPSVYVATSVLTAAVAWYWLFGRSVQKNVAHGGSLGTAAQLVHSDSDTTDYEPSASTTSPDNVRPAYLINAKTSRLELVELDEAAVNDSIEQMFQGDQVDIKDTEEATATECTEEQQKSENCYTDEISLDDNLSTEQLRRKAAEKQVAELRKSLIQAKQETRRANTARATALGTANKAIAFARQTIQIREQLENELLLAQRALENRHVRVANLAKAMSSGHKRLQLRTPREDLEASTTNPESSYFRGKSVRLGHNDAG